MTKVEVLKNDHLNDVTYVDDKKNIYIFWGNGCAHCEDLRVYLEKNAKLWKNDYQIFSFETWKDEENAKPVSYTHLPMAMLTLESLELWVDLIVKFCLIQQVYFLNLLVLMLEVYEKEM